MNFFFIPCALFAPYQDRLKREKKNSARAIWSFHLLDFCPRRAERRKKGQWRFVPNSHGSSSTKTPDVEHSGPPGTPSTLPLRGRLGRSLMLDRCALISVTSMMTFPFVFFFFCVFAALCVVAGQLNSFAGVLIVLAAPWSRHDRLDDQLRGVLDRCGSWKLPLNRTIGQYSRGTLLISSST